MSLRPLLKIPGAKGWLVPRLQPIWDRYVKKWKDEAALVEPFCGALNIALGLMPTQTIMQRNKAVLCDLNQSTIDLYNYVKTGQLAFLGRKEVPTEKEYYEIRERYNTLPLGTTASAYNFYVLNRCGFNGLTRYSRDGNQNVPWGKYKKVAWHGDLSEYRRRFRNWDFRHQDFQRTLVKIDDFMPCLTIVDPPYSEGFTQFCAEGFDWADQVRLALMLSELPGPVVACNSATRRILDLYDGLGFKIEKISAPRSVSCKADGRKPVLEMFATKGL